MNRLSRLILVVGLLIACSGCIWVHEPDRRGDHDRKEHRDDDRGEHHDRDRERH